MTIKLLTPRDLDVGGRYVTHPVGSLVTLSAATEAGLIASKEATADLTGGIVYAPPVPSGQPVDVEAILSDQGIEFSAAPVLSGVRLLALGTSITNKWSSSLTDPSKLDIGADSYLYWLCVQLGIKPSNVINAGISGNKTSEMLARFESDVAAKARQFDVGIFEPGPNDLNLGSSLDLETAKSQYRQIVQGFRNLGKPLILVIPTPTEFANTDDEKALYAGLRSFVVAEWGVAKDVLVVDAGSKMCGANGLPLSALYAPTAIEPTRVHPSVSGAQVIGRTIASHPRIAQVLPGDYDGYFSQGSSDPNEYLANPLLVDTASGTYQMGGGVTGTGVDCATVFVPSGSTFTTKTTAPAAVTGDDVRQAGGLDVTLAGAGGDVHQAIIRLGSTDGYAANHSARGRWDLTRANTTVYAVGDHARLAGDTTGILTCIVGGTSGASAPVPSGKYGAFVTDGTVTWKYQKLPAPGDVFVAVVEYEISNISGGVLLLPKLAMQRTDATDPERFGQFQVAFDKNASGAAGQIGVFQPRRGLLQTLPITLRDPGVSLRHVFIDLTATFPSGGGANIRIKRAGIRKL